MSPRELRITRNEDLFREINERIAELENGRLVGDELLPLVCECANTGCIEVIQVDPATYSSVREHPHRFLVASGHEHGEAVIGHSIDYVIVEKQDPGETCR